jgi:hypothetical protein
MLKVVHTMHTLGGSQEVTFLTENVSNYNKLRTWKYSKFLIYYEMDKE